MVVCLLHENQPCSPHPPHPKPTSADLGVLDSYLFGLQMSDEIFPPQK